MIQKVIESTCRQTDSDSEHFVFALHPLGKTLRFSSYFSLILQRSQSSWSWMISLRFDSVKWLCSQLVAVAEWEFGTVRSAQSRDASQRLYNHLLHKWVRLWNPPSGVLWMKEGEKNIYINMIQMQKNWMFSPKRLRRSRHFFIWLMNLYESTNVVIAALWFG